MPRKNPQDVVLKLDEELEQEESKMVLEEAGPKMVEVIPMRDFKCRIGGTNYQFFTERPQLIPESVEKELRRDKAKLYPKYKR